MRHENYTATTFTYKRDSQWKFKHIVAYRKKMIRDVTCTMVDRFIEDYEDEKLKPRIDEYLEEASKNGYVDWNQFKRRMGLDEPQNYG